MKYLGLIITLFLLISCAPESIESHWYNKDITADGNDDDWNESYLFVNNDLQLVYGVSNNDRYVNILIRFQNENLARRMLVNGFTIWLNKDNTKGICFEDQIARDRFIERFMEGDRNRDSARKPVLVGGPADFRNNWLKGRFYLLGAGVKRDLQEDKDSSVKAAAGERDGFYCLEYKIKYTVDDADNNFLNVSGDAIVDADLEISALPDEIREKMEKQRSDRYGRGERGYKQPPMAGGRHGGPAGPRQNENETISLRIKLAVSK